MEALPSGTATSSLSFPGAVLRRPAPFGGAKGLETEVDREPEWTSSGNYGAPGRLQRGSAVSNQDSMGAPTLDIPPHFGDSYDAASPSPGAPGRASPARGRGGGSLSMPQAPSSLDGGDPVHVALMRLAEEFPVVHCFQRINYGFYRVEGRGTCELSVARNSEKLFVKQDNWNRGVRGELTKFLQTISVDGPPSRTPSEKSLQVRSGTGGGANAVGNARAVSPSGRAGAAAANSSAAASTTPPTFRPPDRERRGDAGAGGAEGGGGTGAGNGGPLPAQGASGGSMLRGDPKKLARRSAPGQAGSGAGATASGASGASGAAARRSAAGGSAAQRRSVAQTSTPRGQAAPGNLVRYKEGALFVHAREPLYGDPLVLLRAVDAASGAGDAGELRAMARLLCNGRTAEVRASYIVPLELRPPCSSLLSLAGFEELFLLGRDDEVGQALNRNVFGFVELGELNTQRLQSVLASCWPQHMESPQRGLAWALRPYFVDWLKRRQRLRNFIHLIVGLSPEVLRRDGSLCANLCVGGAPMSLESMLLDVTERDLLIALLMTTPQDQRARLYSLAADAGMSLPLAFPALRSPCPPPWDQEGFALSGGAGGDVQGAAAPPQAVDRGVSVQWEAFEALLARPADRPMLLSVGAMGASQCGKSALLQELLGLGTTEVPTSGARPATRGASAVVPCSSPMHTPGVDLLRSTRGPVSWTADAHGCALGDPAFMALISALAATAAMVVLHISADDFHVQVEEEPPPRPPPTASSKAGTGSTRVPLRRGTASGAAAAQANREGGAERSESAPSGPPKVSVKPDLLALMRVIGDARVPGVGSMRMRVLVLLRDAPGQAGQLPPQQEQLMASFRTCVEAVLGPCMAGMLPVENLTSLKGGYRHRALAGVRAQLQQELGSVETPQSHSAANASTAQFPSVETLKKVYGHFYDRLTLAGERPVVAASEFAAHSKAGERLVALLDEAEQQAQGQFCALTFPVSEAASQLARLKVQEKRLLDQDDAGVDDAAVAKLAASLRALERKRRAMLADPLSLPVRFFVETVLADARVKYAKASEFSQYLNAWRQPRQAPLLEKRRGLLDARLQLSQDRRIDEKTRLAKLESLSEQLADTEQAIEQLNVSLDNFWSELAAVDDLSAELQGLGIRPPPELPDSAQLKAQYAQWAWSLNNPLQLLHGSPLQCAGSFLVEVLKDLGAKATTRELFVISVIGIQSSAKSTLLNYLFGCGFATSAGRCTRGLYCSLMETDKRTLLILDTEGLMSLEAEGGDVFDAQLALMAMACSHLVLINHKGELSRQLQDLLEVCLFAMQHLKVTKLQPKLLFVLRDQHDRSNSVHGDALRLMRKHLAEASSHLSLRLDDLIALDPDSIFLLPSAFASDVCPNTGGEVIWSTGLFAQEALRLRRKIFVTASGSCSGDAALSNGDGAAPEFSTLPDWCLHAMSVWRVLDRFGPNLLHYKTIQEIEVQRELEDLVKQISSKLINSVGGLAEKSKALLADCTQRLATEASEQVDTEFRSSLQALLDVFGKRCQGELEEALKVRKSKIPDARKDEAKKKLQTPVEYQGELTRYTWTLALTEAVDRDQLRALKVHFKKTIEELWQAHSSQTIADEQARQIFASEWKAFEDKCRSRFEQTAKSKRQLAEEVCLVFNHALRQHRHSDEALHVVELVPASTLLNEESMLSWDAGAIARNFLEVRSAQRLAEYAAQKHGDPRRGAAPAPRGSALETAVVPEMKKHLWPALTMDLPEGSTQVPAEDVLLAAMRRLNDAVQNEETRFLAQLGVRFQGGRAFFLNAAHMCLRHSVLSGLVEAETKRCDHQWTLLQSHRQKTEEEFLSMVQRHTSDAGRAGMLADQFFDALAREWLDETLVAVAADIRAHCLADMPDASGAAERAYQQAFVERNWEEVLEYVLDVNAYLHKIFSTLFEDRKASITRAQRPQLVRQLGSLFDSLTGAAHRWGHRCGGKRAKLSQFQGVLREMAAESRAVAASDGALQPWPLLSERFPVVADFEVEDPARFAHELGLRIAERLGGTNVEGLVAERLEAALHKQQAQVWALIRGCSAMCPCCGSKCDRVDNHTTHCCSHHLLPAFNGWRVAGTCEAALDACRSRKNHEAPKRSDFSDHLFPNLHEYLKAEHSDWLPFPKEDRELLADSVLKAAWVNCRAPLLARYDMVDSTPAEWINAYEEPQRKLRADAIDLAEERLIKYGYDPEGGAAEQS
eukprot:TRINITY_DN11788_c0_g2_i1.p1 TRINITY_DN11788_c0_g2~~TRINITY_DN11788_c0_g2_i1.p1  ORF type:complete len:2215 (+),score=596.05 TRINITY_DN11788_c0_g2_i1:126-6770(+)